jgi:UDP-N-acetylmuramoyl-tripeptide--D-alanyl-D-alanine ligase
VNKILPAMLSYYRPYYVVSVVRIFKNSSYNSGTYTQKFLQSKSFAPKSDSTKLQAVDLIAIVILGLVAVGQIAVAGLLFQLSFTGVLPEAWLFASALLLALPVVIAPLVPLAHVLAVLIVCLSPKKFGYSVLSSIFEWQVKRLRVRNNFQVVGVVGSVGKTSTKLAIAQVLQASGLKVRHQDGNYNVRLTVPLVMFDKNMPHIFNVPAWIGIFLQNEKTIANGYAYDTVVLELGTDGPGQIAEFAYLKPDLVVVTAVAPEHMEYFGSLDAVAQEELSVASYAKKLLINTDDVAREYLKGIKFIGYGLAEDKKSYTAEIVSTSALGQNLIFFNNSEKLFESSTAFLGAQGRKIILAAVAAADVLGIDKKFIEENIASLKPFSGRMQQLEGIKNSLIIDDTYNSAPSSAEAAISVLESINAPQRIAVLGSMNELGDFGPEAHKTIGSSIDPTKIDLVITIGTLAKDYLASAAAGNGCRVVSYLNPHEAGLLVKSELLQGGAVLVKGSQNGVFAEEAIKPILKHKKDLHKLVRQSKYWMHIKRKQFKLPKD